MTHHADVGLRWYEHWLLKFLVRSPRINSIQVELPTEDDEDDVDDERHEADLRQQLEWIYHGPSADEEEQG